MSVYVCLCVCVCVLPLPPIGIIMGPNMCIMKNAGCVRVCVCVKERWENLLDWQVEGWLDSRACDWIG